MPKKALSRTDCSQLAVVSSASLTPPGDGARNQFFVTALAANATVNAPSTNLDEGNTLLIRIKDNGTARTLTWSGSYAPLNGLTLPTNTIAGKTHYITAIYNAVDNTWDVTAIGYK